MKKGGPKLITGVEQCPAKDPDSLGKRPRCRGPLEIEYRRTNIFRCATCGQRQAVKRC